MLSLPRLRHECATHTTRPSSQTNQVIEQSGRMIINSCCRGHMLWPKEGIEMGNRGVVAERENPSVGTFGRKKIPRPENRDWVLIARIRRPSRDSIAIQTVDKDNAVIVTQTVRIFAFGLM